MGVFSSILVSGEIIIVFFFNYINFEFNYLIYFIVITGYLLSKEEGQPGTPEKPLSDLGRVSYHAYWKSIILEYLDVHRNKPITFEDIGHMTGMHTHDIALTFQMLGFIRYIPNNDTIKLGLCVDWNKVDSYMKKLRSRPRLEIDPECLRWTPLLPPTINPFESPEIEGSGDQETDNDEKTESEEAGEPEMVPSTIEEDKEKVKLDTGGKKEEIAVEITSSGRRRTRPLKYSETTYQTTPTLGGEGSRKRRRDLSRKLSESNPDEDKDNSTIEEENTPRRQRSRSVARRSSRVTQNENEEINTVVPRNRRQSVKEPIYASDSQEDIPSVNAAIPTPIKLKKGKRKSIWKGKPRKRQRTNKRKQSASPIKKARLDLQEEPIAYKTDDSVESEIEKTPIAEINKSTPTTQDLSEEKNKENSGESSEDSSGEADDEMDVEEGEEHQSVASKPATPQLHEENSTDHHTSDMELDSIHMDSPKSIAEKEQVINETTVAEDKTKNDESEVAAITPTAAATDITPAKEYVEIKKLSDGNAEIKAIKTSGLDEKETIIISESDDNNSQSCPLPSPKHNVTTPACQPLEKPKDIEENESPSKVIPVVSTENAHIVLDHKIQEEFIQKDTIHQQPPVDLIVPKIHQIETILVEGESDNANSPQTNISPKKNESTVINESPKQKKSPEILNSEVPCDKNKSDVRKETVIQHQLVDDTKSLDRKTSPSKNDSIIQNLEQQRDNVNQCQKKPDNSRMEFYSDIDMNKSKPQTPIISKESEIHFRNDILSNKKDDAIISRNVIEPNMSNFQNILSNVMAVQQSQYSHLNHRQNVNKESQAVQTDKMLAKVHDSNRVINIQPDPTPQQPVISKTTKLEVPNPITSPVINPVIPKVPNMTDINFLPRCQSANAVVNLGLERNDLDNNFANSSMMQNSLGESMSVAQNLQDKNDPNMKPREKSKLRDVRVNSAHSKLEKVDKKAGKADTPRSTPEPKMFFPEQNTTARKPETSVPINVINSVAVSSKVEAKTNEAPKKQDFFKKEKANASKCDNKNSIVKHDKTCANQLKVDQNELNKILPKFKYDNEMMAKADYTMNQIPNYHTSHAQYQWPPWDPTRLQGTWDHNRFLDMKNTDKNYLEKFSQGFNLPQLDQMQKSPQKLHPKYDQKDFHNLAYGALSAGGLYPTTSLPHFKETKPPTSKADCHQKNECKPGKQSKTTTACQTQCESKKSHAQANETQMKQHMMQRAVNKHQEVVTSCAEYRQHQQSPQVLSSPGGKIPYNQNGPCEKTDIEKKSRGAKKEESPKDNKEEMCEAVSPALQSMGVYTPDSTSNSVHSVQYAACDLDVSQLGLESPTSIGSDLSSPCSMMHMHPAPSPQYPHSSIHLQSMMTQPNQPPKQKNINNRSRSVYPRSLFVYYCGEAFDSAPTDQV